MEFEEYVAARGAALLRFAYVLTADSDMAEDLVQSALADAYRHWRRVARADHPDAYVHRIIVNRHLSSRRRRWWGERPSGSAPESEGNAHDASTSDIADAVADRDETRAVLDGLPPRARAVLVLRYYADLDDAAIAQALGITESTVRATASRALASLRQTYPLGDDARRAAAAVTTTRPGPTDATEQEQP